MHREILFGNDSSCLGHGWAEGEPGRRWTLGESCEIRMIHPGRGDLLLEIDAFPLIITPAITLQRIEVVANGRPAGTLTLTDHRRRALHIPAELVPAGEILSLLLLLPDAAQPLAFGPFGDPRTLAVCFSRLRLFVVPAAPRRRLNGAGGLALEDFASRTGIAPAQALARFEALGDTDAFASVRGLAGVQTPGLLEDVAIGLPQLLHGIEAGFEGLGDPGNFDVVPYGILDRTYGATFRSGLPAGEGAKLLRERRRSLARLLAAEDRIYVLTAGAATEQEVLPLAIALNGHRPATLLWVTPADAGHPPGTVQQTAPFLLRGWIGHADGVMAGWLELCANALAIARETVQSMDGEYEKLQDVVFGQGGNEEAVLGFGWSGPEPGYRWTDGSACELWLDHPGERDVVVSIEAWPLIHLPRVPLQVAELSTQDVPLGMLTYTAPSRQAVHIPAAALRRARILRLRCGLPHAERPVDIGAGGDDRKLGLGFFRVAVHAAPGVTEVRRDGIGGIDAAEVQGRAGLLPEDVLMQFEPLGETRVLGQVQAAFGAAAHGLLRNASLRLIDLVRALDTRFAGLGDPARLRHRQFGEDTDIVDITDSQTNLNFVAERRLGDATMELLMVRQARRLRYLRDQLLYDVSMGEKIFVYHRAPQPQGLSDALMLPLLIALRQHGPCTLLFVTPEDSAHPAGTVERRFPGLLHGYGTVSEDADDDVTQAVWLEICVNALLVMGVG